LVQESVQPLLLVDLLNHLVSVLVFQSVETLSEQESPIRKQLEAQLSPQELVLESQSVVMPKELALAMLSHKEDQQSALESEAHNLKEVLQQVQG